MYTEDYIKTYNISTDKPSCTQTITSKHIIYLLFPCISTMQWWLAIYKMFKWTAYYHAQKTYINCSMIEVT